MVKLLAPFAFAICFAATNAFAFNTYRAGSVVLDQNDPASKVINAMGQPQSKEPIFNRYGAQLGENWFYQDGNKTIKFTISGGRVAQIEEIR